MENRRRLLVWASPAIGLTLVVLLIVSRRDPVEEPAKKRSIKGRAEDPVETTAPTPTVRLPVLQRPVQPPPVMATDEARVYPLYQDFRTAVALEHNTHRDALYRALGNNKDIALRLAEAELGAAQDETNREIARKTVDALRR
jgi:hypothetical protein